MALREIFRPERGEVKGKHKRSHCENLHNLEASPKIFGMIKARRMIQTRHEARRREERCIQDFGRET